MQGEASTARDQQAQGATAEQRQPKQESKHSSATKNQLRPGPLAERRPARRASPPGRRCRRAVLRSRRSATTVQLNTNEQTRECGADAGANALATREDRHTTASHLGSSKRQTLKAKTKTSRQKQQVRQTSRSQPAPENAQRLVQIPTLVSATACAICARSSLSSCSLSSSACLAALRSPANK